MAARDQVDPDFKARQLAGFDEQISESRRQRAASACNAASFYAQVGDLDQARPLIDVAASDPEIAAEMAALRKFVSGR